MEVVGLYESLTLYVRRVLIDTRALESPKRYSLKPRDFYSGIWRKTVVGICSKCTSSFYTVPASVLCLSEVSADRILGRYIEVYYIYVYTCVCVDVPSSDGTSLMPLALPANLWGHSAQCRWHVSREQTMYCPK